MTASLFRMLAFGAVMALVAFTAAFPFIPSALVRLSSCQGVGGACGAVAAVIGLTLKPLGVQAALLALAVAVGMRMMRLGMSTRWTIAAAVMFVALIPGLTMMGNFWGANFGLGLLRTQTPIIALFCIAIANLPHLTPQTCGDGGSSPAFHFL